MTMCKLSFLIPGSVVLGSVGSTRAQALPKASLGPGGYGMAYTGSIQVQHQAWGVPEEKDLEIWGFCRWVSGLLRV